MYYFVCYFNRGTLRDKPPVYRKCIYLTPKRSALNPTRLDIIDRPFIEHYHQNITSKVLY